MRTLVNQTYELARMWAADTAKVYKLIGGETEEVWELTPEQPSVLVCTMDMALSRMLNRGYAMSRYRWPVAFGLLNNDALLVCDEVQLMGNGLATSTQLEAFRSRLGTCGPAATWWMSATLDPVWLSTVDHPGAVSVVKAGEDRELERLRTAPKALKLAPELSERELAASVIEIHRPGTLTLAVVNTVARAQVAYEEVRKRAAKLGAACPDIVLAHSRFREQERRRIDERLRQPCGESGRIVIASQVVEAGVDISARAMVTDLAPWASLVQRFGRVNRRREYDDAVIVCAELSEKRAKPYEPEDLAESRARLCELGSDGSIARLEAVGLPQKRPYSCVLRRKDVIELFDTSSDLSGADVDVSRFIREHDDADVAVFWRDVDAKGPGANEAGPAHVELCSVPAYLFREEYIGKGRPAYRWDWIDKRWRAVERADEVAPGATYLLPASAGGYDVERGWQAERTSAVAPLPARGEEPESDDEDRHSQGYWLRINEHTDNLARCIAAMNPKLPLSAEGQEALSIAVRWHDRGKSHPVFQSAVGDDAHPGADWAKGCGGARYARRGFRHELASALATLESAQIPPRWRSLVAYLVAAHHGKVRTNIRSIPNEERADAGRFARGIWDGDVLPATDLGAGVIAEPARLTLDVMEVGSANGLSWSQRVWELVEGDEWGPFRLAYLEAVLRAADRRASEEECREARNAASGA